MTTFLFLFLVFLGVGASALATTFLIGRFCETRPVWVPLGLVSFVGGVVFLFLLFPYWLFGSSSAIGWYDEFDFNIPYTLLKATEAFGADISPLWANSASFEAVTPALRSPWTLTLLLYAALDPIVVGVLFRLLSGMLIFAAAIWTTLRLASQHKADGNIDADLLTLAVLAGLLAPFTNVYFYGWSLGGLGLSLGASWLGALLVTWRPCHGISWGLWASLMVVVAYAGSSSGTSVGFFVFAFPPIALVLFAATPAVLRPNFQFLAISGVLLTFLSLGMHTSELEQMIFGEFSESARFNETKGFESITKAAPGFLQSLATSMISVSQHLFLGYSDLIDGKVMTRRQFPPTVIMTALVCVTVILCRDLRILWLAAGLVLLGALEAFSNSVLAGTIFSSFRINQVYPYMIILLPAFGSAAVAKRFARAHANNVINSVARILFLGVSITAFAILSANPVTRSLNTIQAYGGWAILDHWGVALANSSLDLSARAVSAHSSRPKAAALNMIGLRAVDGLRPSFTPLRTAFWFTNVNRTQVGRWHTHRQIVPRGITSDSAQALEIMGVRYVFSFDTRFLEGATGDVWLEVPELRADGWVRALPFGIDRYAPPLIATTLSTPWPHVFEPAEVLWSNHPQFDEAYMREVFSLETAALLLPADTPPEFAEALERQGDADITLLIDYEEIWDGVILEVSGSGGTLVLNSEWTSRAVARCSYFDGVESMQTKVLMVPVHGIHTALYIPPSCREVHVFY